MTLVRYLQRPGSRLSDRFPRSEFDPVADRLSRLMDESFLFGRRPDDPADAARPWIPAMDVEETEEALVLTADLPGFDPSEVEISVENQVLTVSGSRERIREMPVTSSTASGPDDHGAVVEGVATGPATGRATGAAADDRSPETAELGGTTEWGARRLHLSERRWGSFIRSFTLPRTVRSEEIAASFDRGVLTIRMPKSAEARPRRIEIRTGA